MRHYLQHLNTFPDLGVVAAGQCDAEQALIALADLQSVHDAAGRLQSGDDEDFALRTAIGLLVLGDGGSHAADILGGAEVDGGILWCVKIALGYTLDQIGEKGTPNSAYEAPQLAKKLIKKRGGDPGGNLTWPCVAGCSMSTLARGKSESVFPRFRLYSVGQPTDFLN